MVWDRVYEIRQRAPRGEERRVHVAKAQVLLAAQAGFATSDGPAAYALP